MAKILVTGGMGFLGSHLIEQLLDQGHEVTIIDNMSTNAVDKDFFKGRAELITKSIQEADFSRLGKCDFLYHLACVVGPSGILKHAGRMGLDIMLDTKILNDFCIKNDAKMIDISTSEVYGQSGFISEESDKHIPGTVAVRTEYGAGKLLAEIMTINRAKVEPKLKYHIIRPFNISGPRQKPDNGFVLPRFVISALTNQPITVFGDGSQERAFTHVKEISSGIISIANSRFENESWNVGNPYNRTTILNLAKMVQEETRKMHPDKDPKIVFVDGKKIHGPLFEEVPDKLPHIDKIKSKVGWEPKVPLRQVVKETIQYYEPLVKKGFHYKMI